jgi:hypothetical protein
VRQGARDIGRIKRLVTIAREAYEAPFVADILEIEGTGSTRSAVNSWLDRNMLTGLKTFYSLADFKNCARELVAKGHGDSFFRHWVRNFWSKSRAAEIFVEVWWLWC